VGNFTIREFSGIIKGIVQAHNNFDAVVLEVMQTVCEGFVEAAFTRCYGSRLWIFLTGDKVWIQWRGKCDKMRRDPVEVAVPIWSTQSTLDQPSLTLLSHSIDTPQDRNPAATKGWRAKLSSSPRERPFVIR
jgi:hypothetical protein